MSFCRKIAIFSLYFAVCMCAAAAADTYTVQSYIPSQSVSVQTIPPAAPPPSSLERTRAFESQPLNFPEETPAQRERAAGRREVAMPSIWPALLSVAAVCGLFCGALYLIKKYLPGHRQLFNHPAVEVLGRTHIDQKRSVSLIRVGRRVLVVGVSPDDMRALSEITDEAEITEIMEVARPKTEAGLSLFQKLFRRNVLDAEAAEAGAMADLKARELKEQMRALRSRVAEIAPARERQQAEHFDAVG